MKPTAAIRALNFVSVATGKTHKQSFRGVKIGLTVEFKTPMYQIFLEGWFIFGDVASLGLRLENELLIISNCQLLLTRKNFVRTVPDDMNVTLSSNFARKSTCQT